MSYRLPPQYPPGYPPPWHPPPYPPGYPPQGSNALWIVLGVLGGAIFLFCGGVAFLGSPGISSAPTSPAVSKSIVNGGNGSTTAIDAVALHGEYDANEVAADAKYHGRVFDVTGTVREIGKDFLGNSYVDLTLNPNGFLSSVHCGFNESENAGLARLTKGQDVTIHGRCTGFVVKTVEMKDCQLR